MTEDRVGFLCNIAFSLPPKNDTYKILKSYYLMRCNEVTKGYGLPPKYFSSKARCPHCYLDWTRDSDVKIQPVKLSKRQRLKIMTQKKTDLHKDTPEERNSLRQNEMVQVCTFCRRSTKTHLKKPEKLYKSTTSKEQCKLQPSDQQKHDKKKGSKKPHANKKAISSKPEKKNDVVNLYTNAFDVFSLKNDKNTLSSTIKVPPRVIKNNKKKKDKFAGLCQKAVLASTKLKEQKEKKTSQPPQNKLNLFLKPSSG